jgi:hypothetical protein
MTLQERLMSKIKKVDNGCWEWQGSFSNYGRINVDGKPKLVHRIAYELWVGTIPADMHICHKCDNTRCCNPEHLWAGTNQDNRTDSVNKNRHGKGSRMGIPNNKHNRKLTDEQVAAIRSDNRTHSAIAATYNVSRSLITMIRNNKLWT